MSSWTPSCWCQTEWNQILGHLVISVAVNEEEKGQQDIVCLSFGSKCRWSDVLQSRTCPDPPHTTWKKAFSLWWVDFLLYDSRPCCTWNDKISWSGIPSPNFYRAFAMCQALSQVMSHVPPSQWVFELALMGTQHPSLSRWKLRCPGLNPTWACQSVSSSPMCVHMYTIIWKQRLSLLLSGRLVGIFVYHPKEQWGKVSSILHCYKKKTHIHLG